MCRPRARRGCRPMPWSSTAAAWRARCRSPPIPISSCRPMSVPTACRRESCTTRAATAAPPRACFTSPKAASRCPPTRSPFPSKLSPPCWSAALRPPAELLTLPFTAGEEQGRRCFVSLLLRPLVCPAAGQDPEKTMEIRFFAPGSLVSNLDFVESIFGNAGDPYLPENDAALDVLHWTGHTGCVILAPHLVGISQEGSGPAARFERSHRAPAPRRHVLEAGRRALQRRPAPSRSPAATHRGVMVTLIADNYFGYCKKEVKTQISFAANLYGWLRGGARRRRHRLPHLRARARISTPDARPSA